MIQYGILFEMILIEDRGTSYKRCFPSGVVSRQMCVIPEPLHHEILVVHIGGLICHRGNLKINCCVTCNRVILLTHKP